MKCCAVIAGFLLIAGINSYEFEDSAFNEILAGDLKDLYSSSFAPIHSRSRRDEEAVIAADKCRGKKRRTLCCGEQIMEEVHNKQRELKRECFREMNGRDKRDRGDRDTEFDPFRCEKVDKHRREITCVMDCVAKKQNLLDSDGNPVDEKFASFVKETFEKESWFAPMQDKVISTCLTEAKNATKANQQQEQSSSGDASTTANGDPPTDVRSCNPAGVKLAHCLFRETQLNCPADQIKEQKSCDRLRERLSRHEDFIPPPPQAFNDE